MSGGHGRGPGVVVVVVVVVEVVSVVVVVVADPGSGLRDFVGLSLESYLARSAQWLALCLAVGPASSAGSLSWVYGSSLRAQGRNAHCIRNLVHKFSRALVQHNRSGSNGFRLHA